MTLRLYYAVGSFGPSDILQRLKHGEPGLGNLALQLSLMAYRL